MRQGLQTMTNNQRASPTGNPSLTAPEPAITCVLMQPAPAAAGPVQPTGMRPLFAAGAPQITTQRLTIRPVTPDDLGDLFEINGDAEVTALLPYATWQSPADGIAWLVRMENLVAAETANQCVILRTADQKILGTVLLFNFNRASASIELGYVLGQPHRRQGYAKEALAAVCHHVFANLGLRRIEAEVTSHNLASNALLLRLGFVREGCLRQRWVANGVAHDSHVYGCLAGEWARPVGVEDTRVCT